MIARRALFLVNPKASRAETGLDAVIRTLTDGGVEPVRPLNDDVDTLIRRHARAVECVIIGGGDGTLNRAAPALMETGLPLGILPLGTANDLARTLELPADPAAAAQVIVDGRLRSIDLGEVNGRPFFNVASLGMSVELAKSLDGDTKKRWGRFGYALAALRLVRRLERFSAEIRTDDGKIIRGKSIQIAVGNGRYYGGGMSIAEDAAPDDGMLDLYSIEVDHWMWLALMYPSFRAGRHGRWDEVHALRCRSVEVRTRRPRDVNTDGEVTTQTPATFRVLPKAIRVYTPMPVIPQPEPLAAG
ncbi:lipid kinase [Inquilinus limosus]|uniref:Lipid kinase n=1 Tax=Inquilinus limosus MP06 TaxID=1398085 RepID=A0A0A0D0G6_9PROT|nr:lipid kinase [Inquilinus limosus]KGM31555.1 lipid kinase [Inquilinus limosus MP06]